MVLSDCYSWANEQFGHTRRGDPRRTRRLVSQASSLAQHAGLSIVKSSQPTAQGEGAYRLIRSRLCPRKPLPKPDLPPLQGHVRHIRSSSHWKTPPPLTSATVRNLMTMGIPPLTRRRAGCWLIEEYHKAWKSGGTCVESLRMQTRDNLERMVVIKALIAVRGLDLRQGGVSEETQNDSYEKILTPTEWKLQWVKLEGKPLPAQAPPLKWA